MCRPHATALRCLLAIALIGCEVADPPADAEVRADGGDMAVGRALRLSVRPRIEGAVPPGTPLRYEAEPLERGSRQAGELPLAEAWPRTLELPGLGQGRWRITVFLDRDGDGFFDDCPFPPRAGDSEVASSLDTLSGQVEVRGGALAEVLVEQRICGPGDIETGLAGVLLPPEAEPVPGPVMGLIEPLADLGGEAGRLPALRATLRNGRLTEPLEFSLGELLPGRWRLTVFADADGDASPSPCGDGLGGGDRFVADPVVVTVDADARAALPDPIEISRRDCPERLTGITGEVTLAPGLPADPTFDGPLGPLSGPIRLALFPSTGGEPVADVPILPTVDARPLPHRFTLSGVPPGSWRLVAWIDRDGDESFTPCGGLSGIDAVYLQQEDVRVRDGVLTQLAPLALERNPCDARAETGLTGRLQVEVEPGSVGSGRPVRMELRPLGPGEPRSVQLLENHAVVGGRPAQIIASGLPGGTYDVTLYLDTDRDGGFLSCRQDPFGDRAALVVPAVEIPEGRIVSLGDLEVPGLGCPPPEATLRPLVEFAPEVEPGIEAPLWLLLAEAGGYRDRLRLSPRQGPSLGEVVIPPLVVAPGEYALTAFLDTVADEQLGGCGTEAEDAVVGRVTVRLDAARPEADPRLTLRPACDR